MCWRWVHPSVSKITEDFPRKKRVIDDACLWDWKLKDHFYHVVDFLTLTSNNGIIQNPTKFVFGKTTIDFVGFNLNPEGVAPSEEILTSIKEFPKPKNITGMRSLFGLIEQVSWGFSKHSVMAPFRELLSGKNDFIWTDEMDEAFESAKAEIVAQVKDGVKVYEMGKTTALVSDWSKTGLGYALLQKHCFCSGKVINCCARGWKLVCMGSRFCTQTESKYSAIEGELLALTFALEKSRYWTLGNPDLVVFVDHKPLLGLLKNKDIDTIENPRLNRLMIKTLKWNFEIHHVAGLDNCITDALSRFPSKNTAEINEIEGELLEASCVTWEQVIEASMNCSEIKDLKGLLN